MKKARSEMTKANSIVKAMRVVTKAMKEDAGYWMSWQANIAMAFVDAYNNKRRELGRPLNRTEVHALANEAAIAFLELLCWDQRKTS